MALRLSAGDLTLDLLPETGGSIGAFRLKRGSGAFDLLRPMGGPMPPDALYSGMFPMVPFANCIRDNRFVFGGHSYDVAPNMAGSRLNFHGSGWQSAWQVTAADATRTELQLPDGRVGDVYRYAATQVFGLDPNGLTVETRLTNHGDRPMPFSFGQHPWFPTDGRAMLRFAATHLWLGKADGEVNQMVAVPPEADYAIPRPAPAEYRNTCYAGWDGRADITWPDADIRLTLTADPVFGHLMFHVPSDGQKVFCLEPQTNAPCAFDGLAQGHVAPGVHILNSGASVAGAMRFAVSRPGISSLASEEPHDRTS